MRSMIWSLALAVGAMGFALATPAQTRADELAGPAVTSGNTMPVAYWGGRGFYRGYYPGFYGGYRSFYPGFYGGYGGYYPYGGFYRRGFYGGGLYRYGGFGGLGYPGFYW